MSIQSEIDRIRNNVSDALAAVSETGVLVPDTATSDDLGTLIRSIDTSRLQADVDNQCLMLFYGN